MPDDKTTHPAPWRYYEDEEGCWHFKDANGDTLIGEFDMGASAPNSPYVRRVMELAPVLEARLRKFVDDANADSRGTDNWNASVALLAELDAAKAAVVESDPEPPPPVCAHCNVPMPIVEDPPGYERWRCQFAGCPGHYWDRQPCWGEMHVYRAADPDALWAPAPRPSMACSGHIDAFRSEHPHSNDYKAKDGP